jgi:hypothetical protein
MAKTTAEIDGDSSGLVGALDKGRDGMAKMVTSGKKLSDQLKEVADKADIAAGSLVERIGGPKAIAAIGGVGIALGAAKVGVEAFLGSAESLFKSFGDEGMKVWDETEKGLFAVKGAFAEAVLGGGSVEQMGERLSTIFDGVKVAMQAVLLPLRLVSEGIWAVAGSVDGLSLAESKAAENETRYREALDGTLQSIRDQKIAYDELGKTLGDVVISKQETARMEYEATLAAIDHQIAVNDENRAYRANAAAELAAAKAAELLFASSIASTRDKADRELRIINDGVRQSQRDVDARAREMLLENSQFKTQMFIAQADARAQAFANNAGMTKDEIDTQNELLRRRENFVQKAEELNFRLWNPEKPATTGTGGGTKPPKEPPKDLISEAVAAAKARAEAAAAAAKVESDALAKTIEASYETFGMGLTRILFGKGDIKTSFQILGEEVKAIWNGVVEDTVTGMGAVEDATKKTEDAHSAFYDKYIASQARMVGAAIGNGETMAEIGQKSVGMVISALGEQMLSMASVAFFSGNFAGSAGLTAGAIAAFATATALGASGKKTTTSTPATAATPSPVTNNTSYNLQVDAAFADEESIGRAFSKAQAIAKSRHMFREAVERY